MKSIYEFTVKQKVKKEITEVQDNGDKTIKIQEVSEPLKVILKSPSRQDLEEAKIIYNATFGNCVRRGILPRALMEKLYQNENGLLSEPEKVRYEIAANRMVEIRDEYKAINDKEEKDDFDTKQIDDLISEFSHIEQEFNTLDTLRNDAFKNTAEIVAQEKQILWLTMFLTYIEVNGKTVPFVLGETLDKRLDACDAIIDNTSTDEAKSKSKLYKAIVNKAGIFVGAWAMGKIETFEQFKLLDERLDSGDIEVE